MADTKFKALRRMQEEQRNQFTRFMSRQKEVLVAYQSTSRAQKIAAQTQAVHDLQDAVSPTSVPTPSSTANPLQHPSILTKLEDKHLTAEIDLREAQSQEKRNCLLAIRHMEAYCNGHSPEGITRTVTEQDRKELERQHWQRDHLDLRHEAAINVLREQQARQVRLCAQKLEAEVAALEQRNREESEALERALEGELREFEEVFLSRRARLVARWELAAEIWKKRQVDEGILEMPFPIAPVEWPGEARAEGIAVAY